jgi:hypothetical protein
MVWFIFFPRGESQEKRGNEGGSLSGIVRQSKKQPKRARGREERRKKLGEGKE